MIAGGVVGREGLGGRGNLIGREENWCHILEMKLPMWQVKSIGVAFLALASQEINKRVRNFLD